MPLAPCISSLLATAIPNSNVEFGFYGVILSEAKNLDCHFNIFHEMLVFLSNYKLYPQN